MYHTHQLAKQAADNYQSYFLTHYIGNGWSVWMPPAGVDAPEVVDTRLYVSESVTRQLVNDCEVWFSEEAFLRSAVLSSIKRHRSTI